MWARPDSQPYQLDPKCEATFRELGINGQALELLYEVGELDAKAARDLAARLGPVGDQPSDPSAWLASEARSALLGMGHGGEAWLDRVGPDSRTSAGSGVAA
jgi:hypothetical protein